MSDQIVIKDYDKPLEYNVKRLEQCLAGISPVAGVQHRLSELFVALFLENFLDTPLSSKQPLNWSNWTHHTYFAIRATAKAMGLICTFETMGRLDAVIEHPDEYPGAILVAEWETNSSSIFGEHKELDKLWTGVHKHEYADAFLFTYCSVETLYDLTKRVVEYWQSRGATRQTPPNLFLTIMAYRRVKRSHDFLFTRTIEIKPSSVLLWPDIGWVTSEEYLKCIENL